MATKKENIESKLSELEALVLKFEQGKFDIDQGIKEYENAKKLVSKIKKELEAAALKINEVNSD